MRYLIFILFCFTSHGYELENPVRATGVGNGQMANSTRDALMSYDFILERSDYLIFRFKQMTLGDYADRVMIFAPLISGQFEINAYKDINLFYDRHAGRGGFKYNINF